MKGGKNCYAHDIEKSKKATAVAPTTTTAKKPSSGKTQNAGGKKMNKK